jgi:hypothetical protein
MASGLTSAFICGFIVRAFGRNQKLETTKSAKATKK